MKLISQSLALLRPLYEFIYPPTCLACDTHLAEDERTVCASCWSSIRKLSIDDELYCEKRSELISRRAIDGLASAFHFERDGTLRKLVHHLKYDDMPSIGVELGKFVAASLPAMIDLTTPVTALVPVPLHPTKKRERGYNQSEYICKGIGAANSVRVLPNLLKRTRHTRTQTKLDMQERKENVADAFALNTRFESLVRGATFLIVDDIITTGATIDECARVLKAHGAERLYAVSVAVPDHAHLP